MARIPGIANPFNPSIIEPPGLDPNVPWYFLDGDLPPALSPRAPLIKDTPPLPPIPEPPKTLWPGGPDAQRNANDIVRQDFSALRNFDGYRPSYLPSSNAVGSVAPLVPVGSLPGGRLMTPGVTWGGGYVGSTVAAPIPFIAAAPQGAPGGLPGLLIESGLNDPLNPDAPLPGGLVGLIQEYLHDNSRGSN